MQWKKGVAAAVAGLAVVMVGSLLIMGSQTVQTPTVLATAAELREITFAERNDDTPQMLAAKNDDGHTKMWNAEIDGKRKHLESKTVRQAVAQSEKHDRAYYGLPRFHAHSTGWVQDFAANRDRFGLPINSAHAALQQQGKTTELLQTTDLAQMSGAQKAAALQQVKDWETKELRTSFPDPTAAAAKAAADNVWNDAKKGTLAKAPTQQLWNAAADDEITLNTIGHMHPSEMQELQRMSPEYKATQTKGAHITTETEMHYEPLRWMHEQREPGAIAPRVANKHAKLSSKARFTELWNAAENDDIHAGEGDRMDKGFHPSQWLAEQHDRTEMGSDHQPTHKLFRTDADHQRNYGGSYVDDNSIGIKIDNLHARPTMLAQLPQKITLSTTMLANVTDENAEIKKELDDLRDLAMDAVGNMPDDAGPVVQAIARGDYEAVKAYLDEVAANATGIPRGAAAAGSPQVLAAVGNVPTKELMMAIDAAMRPPLEELPAQVKAAKSDEEKAELVMHALSSARDNLALVLSDPKATLRAAQFQQAYEVRVLQNMRLVQMRQLQMQQMMANQARQAHMMPMQQQMRQPMIRLA